MRFATEGRRSRRFSSVPAGLRRLNPVYSPIAFSLSAEDPLVAEAALSVGPGARLVCLGAGGETPLSLLAAEPGQIDAVDASFPQVCLITLKAEAVRRLSLAEVHVLLGVEGDGRRALALYETLRPFLPARIRAFWDAHRAMLAAGVLWQGTIQRAMRLCRRTFGLLLGPRWLDELKTLSAPEEVDRLVDRLTASRRFRLLLRLMVNRVTVATSYPGSGLANLGTGVTPREYVVARLRDLLSRRPPGRYPQVVPLFFGDFPCDDALPPYLQPALFPRVKAQAPRLRVVNADIHSYLSSLPDDSVDGFALSNLIDWLDDGALSRLLDALVRCGRPGARALISSRSHPPEERVTMPQQMAVDAAQSSRLNQQDRIGYHRFNCLLQIQA